MHVDQCNNKTVFDYNRYLKEVRAPLAVRDGLTRTEHFRALGWLVVVVHLTAGIGIMLCPGLPPWTGSDEREFFIV